MIGLLVEAVQRVLSDESPATRTLSVQLFGATLPGPARLSVTPLRVGSGGGTYAATLRQGDDLRAHGVVCTGRVRRGAEHQLPAVDLPPWRDVPAVGLAAMGGPRFASHYEYRPVIAPFAAGPEPVTAGWLRPVTPPRSWGPAHAAALVDAWWPALFSTVSAPIAMVTLAYDVHLTGARELPPGAIFRYEGRCEIVHEGYASEIRRLWSEDGRLVALCHQTFALAG